MKFNPDTSNDIRSWFDAISTRSGWFDDELVDSAAAGTVNLSGVGNIASAEAFGVPSLSVTVAPTGIPTAEAFGTPSLAVTVALTGIASTEAFGTPTISTGTPAAATPAQQDSGSGGGGHYQPANSDFWEIRERYLRRFQSTIIDEDLPTFEDADEETVDLAIQIAGLQADRAITLARAQNAATRAELRLAAAKLAQLQLDISLFMEQYSNRVAILLLLDLF